MVSRLMNKIPIFMQVASKCVVFQILLDKIYLYFCVLFPLRYDKIIRIFNGRKVLIENSVTWVTVRHHEACQVMPDSYPELQNFQFEPYNHYRFFFCSFSCILFLNMCFFYQYYAKVTTFFSDQEMFGWLLLYVDVETFGGNLRENDVKTSK